MTTLWIALAGGFGAVTRFAVDGELRRRLTHHLPWATAIINLTGSFLLGVVVGSTLGHTWASVIGTGFLGGYTTFSTASFETARLALERRYAAAFGYGLGVLALGVALAFTGFAVGQHL